MEKPALPAGLKDRLTAALEEPETEESEEDPADRERDQKFVLAAAAALAVGLFFFHLGGPGVASQKNEAAPLAWSAR